MTNNTTINLQATLSAASAVAYEAPPFPHHACVCNGRLYLTEENRLGCEHIEMPADDSRTKACITHSVVILLFEILAEREGMVKK